MENFCEYCGKYAGHHFHPSTRACWTCHIKLMSELKGERM